MIPKSIENLLADAVAIEEEEAREAGMVGYMSFRPPCLTAAQKFALAQFSVPLDLKGRRQPDMEGRAVTGRRFCNDAAAMFHYDGAAECQA
jgi:hypothetical protein